MTAGSRLLLAAGLLVLLSLMVPSALLADNCGVSGNLVVNCGFETGNFTGWTTVPASAGSDFFVSTNDPRTGSFDAEFGAVSGLNDVIFQDIATTPGVVYSFTFWLDSSVTDVHSQFFADFGPNDSVVLTGGFANQGYLQLVTFVDTASSSSTRIEFGGHNHPDFYHLDDISVVPESVATTPDPSSILLLGSGLIGLASLRRRRIFS
jgi:hypothetical protein